MYKYLFPLLLSVNLLHGVNFDQKYLAIERGTPSLDFSKEYPNLDHLLINPTYSYDPNYYLHATNDHGLSKNVNMKTLRIGGKPSQKLLKWAYMPSVEKYGASHVFEDLNYLPNALPFIKSMELMLYFQELRYPGRSDLYKSFENISKLTQLEDLTIHMMYGLQEITEQELSIFQKMQQLKTIKFILTEVNPYFDKSEDYINLIRAVLNNTHIEVERYYMRDGTEGWY